MFDDTDHLDTQYPAVQSVVEEWEDGIVVRTMSENPPTLVEFSFSTGDDSTEGKDVNEVEQEEFGVED